MSRPNRPNISLTSCPVLSALANLLDIDEPMFVGCSGGRDSMSLAFGCYLLYQQGKLSALPTLIHVNHGIQSANDDWAKFVKTWADEHGFACHVAELGLGVANETHARHARYGAFAKCMNGKGILLTAHHQDDQAETVLMRLITGAGVQGLAGMRAWQQLDVNDNTLTVHRPLLDVSRTDITAFAQAHGLSYVDDPTNETSQNARSLIRNDILPRLATLNPKASAHLAKTATLMNEAGELIDEFTFEKFGSCVIDTPHSPFVRLLDVAKLTALSPPMQSAVVREWVQCHDKLPPTSRLTHDIIALAHRTDTDHRTEIFWRTAGNQSNQDTGGAVICRYGQVLYRYHHSLWQLLCSPTPNTVHSELVEGLVMLKSNAHFALTWQFSAFWQTLFTNQSVHLAPIGKNSVYVHTPYHDKHGKFCHAFDKLSGKKLYQKLRIPTWQRHNLWGMVVGGELVLMFGVDEWWLLQSTWFDTLWAEREQLGASLVRVECFAQMGKLG